LQDLKMTDQIAVLIPENAYFYAGKNSFTSALRSKFRGTKCVFFLLQSNVEYHI